MLTRKAKNALVRKKSKFQRAAMEHSSNNYSHRNAWEDISLVLAFHARTCVPCAALGCRVSDGHARLFSGPHGVRDHLGARALCVVAAGVRAMTPLSSS